MIYHIRSKYTAVGRKEIVMFFWMYMLIELLAMFLDSGVIPTANVSYPVGPTHFRCSRNKFNHLCQWFAAVYTGLVAATYCCLLVNGFVGFQFAEDGTPLSLWASPHRNVIHPFSRPAAASPIIMPCCLWCFIFRRHCHIQVVRFLLSNETHGAVCGVPDLANPVCCNLHIISAHSRLPDPG